MLPIIEQLPSELLLMICKHLTEHRDAFALASTSRTLHHRVWAIHLGSLMNTLLATDINMRFPEFRLDPDPDEPDTSSFPKFEARKPKDIKGCFMVKGFEPVGVAYLLDWALQNPYLRSFVTHLEISDITLMYEDLDPAHAPAQSFLELDENELSPDESHDEDRDRSVLGPLHPHRWSHLQTQRYKRVVRSVDRGIASLFGEMSSNTRHWNLSDMLKADKADASVVFPCSDTNSNVYAALLLHRSLFPNITTLFLCTANEREVQLLSDDVLAVLADPRNLPKMHTCILDNGQERGGRVKLDVLAPLLARPTMRKVGITMLVDGVRGDPDEDQLEAWHVPSSGVRHLILQARLNDTRLAHVDECPMTWKPYSILLNHIAGPAVLETLVVREPFCIGPGDEPWEIAAFANNISSLILPKHRATLRTLKLQSKALRRMVLRTDPTPRVTELCPDGIQRVFYDLGARLTDLNRLTNVKSLGIQLWHILGRDFYRDEEVGLMGPPENMAIVGVSCRAFLFPMFLPPNLVTLTIYRSANDCVTFTDRRSSVTWLQTAEQLATKIAVRAIFDMKEQYLPHLKSLVVPIQAHGPIPGRSRSVSRLYWWDTEWPLEGADVGIEVALVGNDFIGEHGPDDTECNTDYWIGMMDDPERQEKKERQRRIARLRGWRMQQSVREKRETLVGKLMKIDESNSSNQA